VDLPTLGFPITAMRGTPSSGSVSSLMARNQHALHQFLHAIAMRGGDSHRLAQTEGMKFRHRRGRVISLRLVHGNPDRLAMPPQIRGKFTIDG